MKMRLAYHFRRVSKPSNMVCLFFTTIFFFLTGFGFSQVYRGGAGTMDSPYWVSERDNTGLLIYESFCGQSIVDSSCFIGDLQVVNILKRQKKIIVDRRNPAGGNTVVRWEGEYNEELILQVFDNFGFGIKLYDGSKFERSYIKDFPNFFNPSLAHVGKWIKRKAQYNYVATANGDVTSSGTETKDNSYENEPNYTLSLNPAKSTEFNFASCGDEWAFSYIMKVYGATSSEGNCSSGNPTMPQTDPFFQLEDYLDWVMGGRQLASYATHVMSMISYSLFNAAPFLEWSNDGLRFDYDTFDDATVKPEIKNFQNL
jgi:hypothetical protein